MVQTEYLRNSFIVKFGTSLRYGSRLLKVFSTACPIIKCPNCPNSTNFSISDANYADKFFLPNHENTEKIVDIHSSNNNKELN